MIQYSKNDTDISYNIPRIEMIRKKFLIWIDILGYAELPEIIATYSHRSSPDIIRDEFVELIKRKISNLQEKGKIIGVNYGGRDDWILITDSMDLVFEILTEILDHDTGYENYEHIPLEIAVGIGEYDKWADFDGKNIVKNKATIDFLNTYIINYYRKWYKNQNKQPISSSFLLFTETAYEYLESFDKKSCFKISYKKEEIKSEDITFYKGNINKVQQRGRVYNFLIKIGQPYIDKFRRIDDLYIPPKEYEEIKNILKEKKMVFITGTPEHGKTYTAVRLLWEYFNNGYEPKWIKGKERAERTYVRECLENIQTYLKPKHIIYFEDPFGSFEYEKRESLERELEIIIDTVKRSEDAYAIITSREEVFKKFKDENYLSAKDIEDFEEKINFKKQSYGFKERAEILLQWAEVNDCKWLHNTTSAKGGSGLVSCIPFFSVINHSFFGQPCSLVTIKNIIRHDSAIVQ